MKQSALMMTVLLTAAIATVWSPKTWAAAEAYLKLSSDHVVYYKHQPAKAGKPTVVLMNGLIYAVENWDEYFTALSQDGTGVLQVAYSTQPESLRGLEGETPFFAKLKYHPLYSWLQQGLETQDLVDETIAVIDSLEIDRFNLVALSYGSIPAVELATQFKDRIDHFILMAPAVVTSGRYNPYGASRHTWFRNLKLAGNLYADYFYDAEIGNTLSFIVTANNYSFSGVPFENFYSGVYQMARSSKWFDLKDYVEVDFPPTSLFVATLEDQPLFQDQQTFWELMQDNPGKRSLVTFTGSYHAIPGVAPEVAAQQTKLAFAEKLPIESAVTVGTGNPPKTLRESLLDYSNLTAEAWGAAK